ncbi:MAG: DNA polymerase Y family protein [Rubrivivax sp.]
MLWFAVHLPWLSLEAFAAALDEAQRRRPLALLAEHEVQAANAAAAAAGVRPGLKRATALALRPDLQFGQADERRDAQALQAVVHTALVFTPAVALDGHTVLLEVASCLRCFGGADALLARLRLALRPLQHRVRIAAAPTALGAALLARWRDGLHEGPQRDDLQALQRLLDQAPVWLLGPGREHWQALQGMGLQRLSELLALPRDGLARRFGEALLDELDRARGTRPDPRPWLSAPERFSARLELAQRAEHAEPLLHAAALLLQQLVAWARARQSRVLAFSLQMRHESRHRADDSAVPAATALRVELAEASVDAAHLQLLLRERLARVALPAPTLELQIDCHELRRQSAPNAELFPTRQSEQAGLQRLLERLRARLGDDCVLALQAVADHRPEKASVLVRAPLAGRAAAVGTSPSPPPASAPDGLLPHPAWLLPQPQPLAEREALPLFQGRLLQLLSGPERIETGWWDGDAATRDYFIAQAADGALVWVFRQRLPVRDPAEPLWYLHGWYG